MQLTSNMQEAVRAVRAYMVGEAHHSSPMLGATLQAHYLGLKEVAIIEFGVARGGGLIDICQVAAYLSDCFGIAYKIYGFDTGQGLPLAKDYRDHPEIWAQGQYPMNDFTELRRKLPPNCELIIGDIAETIREFTLQRLSPTAPLAYIKMDVDYYSSTLAALNILKHEDPSCYLPVVFGYFDDTEYWITYNRWCGERGAIEEFNRLSDKRKIDKMNVRVHEQPRQHWADKIYGCHILDHPQRTGEKPVPHQLQINTATDF